MAPEYFIDHSPSVHSDQFSLAVMAYYLLTKQLPYGTDLARCNSLKQLKKFNIIPSGNIGLIYLYG